MVDRTEVIREAQRIEKRLQAVIFTEPYNDLSTNAILTALAASATSIIIQGEDIEESLNAFVRSVRGMVQIKTGGGTA